MSAEGDPPSREISTASEVKLVKRKREEVDDLEEAENVINISSDAEDDDDEIIEASPPPRSRGRQKSSNPHTWKAEARPNVIGVDSDPEEEIHISDVDEDGVWMYSHRPQRRRRTESPATMADLSDFC